MLITCLLVSVKWIQKIQLCCDPENGTQNKNIQPELLEGPELASKSEQIVQLRVQRDRNE